jgi:hypothetical protein
MQFIDFVPRVDSTKITFPVVSIDPAESSLLREWLAANGPINVTIDSEADYYTTRFKYSGTKNAVNCTRRLRFDISLLCVVIICVSRVLSRICSGCCLMGMHQRHNGGLEAISRGYASEHCVRLSRTGNSGKPEYVHFSTERCSYSWTT